MIKITSNPINTNDVLDSVRSTDAGAALLFLGSTRRWTKGRETTRLEYECYEEMAIQEMEKLAAQAIEKWNLTGCSIVHRVGVVELGEDSVVIAVSSAHRKDTFDAGQWLIDTLKELVPIWKKENWADGTTEWIHPKIERQPAVRDASIRGESSP